MKTKPISEIDPAKKEFFLEILDHVNNGVYFTDINHAIIYWNHSAERISGYSAKEVMGKSCQDGILIHVDSNGQDLCNTAACPLKKTIELKENQNCEAFLKHKEGHRVHVEIQTIPRYDSDQNIIGAVQIFRDRTPTYTLEKIIDKLHIEAYTDPLTKIFNRRQIENVMQDEWHTANDKAEKNFGLLFADVDNLKMINDTYGHLAGDRTLKSIANTLQNAIRESDWVGRWGGDEFIIVLKDIQAKDIRSVANKLERFVASTYLSINGQKIKLGITIGHASPQMSTSFEELIHWADQNMYIRKQDRKAKDSNQVN